MKRKASKSNADLSTAHKGPERVAEKSARDPETVKKLLMDVLTTALEEGKPSNVAREAELLGKMKGVEVFAHPNSDGGAMSVIPSLMQEPAIPASVLKQYETFTCDFCGAEVEGKSELQKHTLKCEKRPIDVPQIGSN